MLYMKIKCKKHTTTTKTTATTKTNNAEHDNLYNRVNAYKSQKKKNILEVCVKSSNCTQQDNVDDVAGSVLYTANKVKLD